MIDCLSQPMTGEHCRAELFRDEHHDALRAACAEDLEIWDIYSISFGPDHFDKTITEWVARPTTRTFVLFDGDELAGMSSFLGIDEARQVLEIGGVREGLLRADRITWTGHVRDTVLFSILKDEWPA